ncbi:ATP-binding protein [Pacificibacter marinus]|uniref:ATP-binding protein n=1 Tax=Pacificibacter marinus TaxID=658057 RepID=UPI001C0660CE|nr:ATP-binding protein [Pacificibacter marinus]MBU2866025.1 ATP-binding protein [Pacificibacter marinus]
MTVQLTDQSRSEYDQQNEVAGRIVALEDHFEKTEVYWEFRKRFFGILAQREARLKVGKTEQKGAALIGPAGAGKSRLAKEVIAEHHALAEDAGDRQFGYRILSVIVPGRATVKETLTEVLTELGVPVHARRDDEYLGRLVMEYFKECGIAGLHLDEVQDSGRYKTSDSIEVFIKRFRNMMQHSNWPICIILTATPEGRDLINHDPTLTRRLRPIEMKPMTFARDGALLRKTIIKLFHDAGVRDAGILQIDEFIKILIHAAVGRFGVAVEMTIEAIGECLEDDNDEIDMSYFADAYALRMDCDEELNPFVSEYWKLIDTMKALQRYDDKKREAVKTLNKRRRPSAA